jgi:cation diffusion facilitator family transporter
MTLRPSETPRVTGVQPLQQTNRTPAGGTRVTGNTRPAAVRKVLAMVLLLNLVVVAIKVIVGIRTQALSVLGAALESSLDLFNNVVGMVLVSVAARAPDETHPYGHAKFETLGALAIVTFLSISCFELLRQAIVQLRSAHVPDMPSMLEVALIALTLVVNAVVVVYERRRGRELSSSFLIADAAHTHSDLYVTVLAIASLGLTKIGLGSLDAVLALLVALIIAWNGYQILRETVPILVDERGLDSADVRRLVERIPRIQEVRSVRSRAGASGVVFAEVTVSVAGSTSVADAHAIADEVESRIAEALGASEVVVHVEPT